MFIRKEERGSKSKCSNSGSLSPILAVFGHFFFLSFFFFFTEKVKYGTYCISFFIREDKLHLLEKKVLHVHVYAKKFEQKLILSHRDCQKRGSLILVFTVCSDISVPKRDKVSP